MCCRVDGWLLIDSILPTLGLSLLYLLMTLSLFMCCRVDGWLLMDSILPTLGLSLLYLLGITVIGPKIMEKR
jgi:hypothetical protein